MRFFKSRAFAASRSRLRVSSSSSSPSTAVGKGPLVVASCVPTTSFLPLDPLHQLFPALGAAHPEVQCRARRTMSAT